jgi:hypothetical protein
MRFSLVVTFLVLISVAYGEISGCSDGSDGPPHRDNEYIPISQPVIEEPPKTGEIYLSIARYDLADLGYQENEWFLDGTATAFVNVNELHSDGFWKVQPAETDKYKTRMVVVRPIDPAHFSGTVFVEWLNTGDTNVDKAPGWLSGHMAIIRDGHAWVGVSTEFAAVEEILKNTDPDRYGSLEHPGDSYAFDIYNQATQALRGTSSIDVLGGGKAEKLISVSYACSAAMMVTLINAIHPLYNPYDGYLLSRRGGSAEPLSQPPQELIETPVPALIRSDLNVPVMVVQSETDLLTLGFIDARQEDTEKFRLWEVAGTSHIDPYSFLEALNDMGTDPGFAVVTEKNFGCDYPVNSGVYQWVFSAALSSMADWVSNAIPPPNADRLSITSDNSSLVYDTRGNALGGVRTPYVDSPAAILSGLEQTGPGKCDLWGRTELFDSALMASLYVDKDGYIRAVSDAADDAVAKGFLLPVDAERTKAAASLQWDRLGR